MRDSFALAERGSVIHTMRFLPNEYADVTAALREHGIDPATVLFVKRRGRLHVELPGRADTFAFFREKSTKLDDQGRWHERVDYHIGMGKKDPCDWSAVMQALTAWLAAA
ncbi:MAG: hypothetical protein KA817_12540 [Flavobacteriales bacterium]|nr:hypothetical protein [Flavobacteriales bacterium]